MDARWLVIPGFLLVAGGTFWVAHVSPETGWAFFIAPLAIAGAGLGALETPTDNTARRDIPAVRSDDAWRVFYTTYLLGIGLGVAVVSAVWQSRVVANARDALSGANLPPAVVGRVSSSLSEDGISGEPSAQIGGPGTARIQDLLQSAFAEAVGAALLSCVAAALLGAVVALFFSSNRKGQATAEEGGSDGQPGGQASD